MFGLLNYLKMGAGVAAGLMLYHLYAVSIGYPSAAREARSGYVLLSEKTTAEAKATEMERQRNEARQAINDYRKQLETAKAQDAKDDIETESRIRSYELLLSEKNRACAADQSDVDFILHKH